MELFFYIIIFIIGSLFGSFYTLAVYRIPKREDITHTHSYCPNCNHKLGLLDLFPIFSYIFLLGKCRYCKEKIRPRYLFLEICSGCIFVGLAYFTNFNYYALTISKIIEFSFLILYFTFVILIAGIDKENKKIDKYVLVYGIVISIMYMLYLYIVGQANIYRYGIYLIFYILTLIIDIIILKKYAKNSYSIGIILMILVMLNFTGEYVMIASIIFTLLIIAMYIIINKIANKKSKNVQINIKLTEKLNIGFYLGIANIVILFISLLFSKILI